MKLTNYQIKSARKLGKQLQAQQPKIFAKLSLDCKNHELADIAPTVASKLRNLFENIKGALKKEIWYYVVNYGSDIPVCSICKGTVNFKPDGTGYRIYCSTSCSYKSQNRSQNIRARKLELEKDPVRARQRIEKYKETSLQNHGFDHPYKSSILRIRLSKVHKNRSAKEKAQILAQTRETNLERYGATHYWKTKENRQKMSEYQQAIETNPKRKKLKLDAYKATNLENLGVEFPMQNPKIKRKVEKTHLRTRGVCHQSKDPEVLSKILLSKKRRKSVTINGEVHKAQGYEPIVLKDLEQKIIKLKTNPRDMPTITYKDPITKKVRSYFADARLKTRSGNKCLLEVKSPYTLCYQLELNLTKFKAAKVWCKMNNYLFILAVCTAKGEISYFKMPTAKEICACANSLGLNIF